MDTPEPHPGSTLRRARRLEPVQRARLGSNRSKPSKARASPGLTTALRARVRHDAELRALTAALAEPRLSLSLRQHVSVPRKLLSHAVIAFGALGILGFVAACLASASGHLDAQSYLEISVASLTSYLVALAVARYACRSVGWTSELIIASRPRLSP